MFCRKGQPIHFRQKFLYAGKCQKTSAFVFFSCSQRLRTRINPLARPRHDGSSPAYYRAYSFTPPSRAQARLWA